MKTLHDSPQSERQCLANVVVIRLAELLGIATAEDVLLDLPEVPLVFACYRGWRLDVYVELEQTDLEGSAWSWVLILSRGDLRGYRLFTAEEVGSAAQHVRCFAEDVSYRRRWFR